MKDLIKAMDIYIKFLEAKAYKNGSVLIQDFNKMGKMLIKIGKLKKEYGIEE